MTASGEYWTWVLVPLIGFAAVYFTIRTMGVQFRLFPKMVKSLFEPAGIESNGKKGISAYQAFSVSAAARVGTGNVIGVSVAISTGGPGAVFWMWTMGIMVASVGFIESALAQLYKTREGDTFVGGPANYIKYGLGKAWMAKLFAVVLIITFPTVFLMVQSNTITDAVNSSAEEFGFDIGNIGLLTVSIILAAIIALIIFGGLRRIAHVAQLMVPAMALLYLIVGIVMVAINIDQIGPAFSAIFEGAFGVREFVGGGIGTAIVVGFQRGMFSNEAGMGSSPVAGATASVSHPAKQGLTQAAGVYFDTMIVCTITAMIIMVSQPDLGNSDIEGQLVQIAVGDSLGGWSVHVITIVLLFLAFTSCLGNYYYGESNIRFLSKSNTVFTGYRFWILAMVIIGGVASLDTVWGFADVTMGAMATVNLIAILMLAPVALKLLNDYSRQLKDGKDPVFTRDSIDGAGEVPCWDPDADDDRPKTSAGS